MKDVGDFRVGDIRACYADLSRAKEGLGYAPRTTLLTGLEQFTFYRASVLSAIGCEVFLAEVAEAICLRGTGEPLKDPLTGQSLSSYIRPYNETVLKSIPGRKTRPGKKMR